MKEKDACEKCLQNNKVSLVHKSEFQTKIFIALFQTQRGAKEDVRLPGLFDCKGGLLLQPDSEHQDGAEHERAVTKATPQD